MADLSEELKENPVFLDLKQHPWRIKHPNLEHLLPHKLKRKRSNTMQISAQAEQVLNQLGEFIAHVQKVCAEKNITPMYLIINVDVKREKDALWAANSLRDYLVNKEFAVQSHIGVAKLSKKYQQARLLSKRKVEIHVQRLTLDNLLMDQDIALHREAIYIDYLFSNAHIWDDVEEWTHEFGLQCKNLCEDQELRRRTDPRVWICLQAIASYLHVQLSDGEDAEPSLSASSTPAHSSPDDRLYNQTEIIKFSLKHRTHEMWNQTLQRLIAMIEDSDSLVSATDPRVLRCLHVARWALNRADKAKTKTHNDDTKSGSGEPALANIDPSLRDIRAFKCPEDDPTILALFNEIDLVSAQVTDPYMLPVVAQKLGIQALTMTKTPDNQDSAEKTLR